MKSLLTTFLFLFFICVLVVSSQSTVVDNTNGNRQAWIQSILSKQDISIKQKDYLFFWTGHNGLIWSLIALDSCGIYLNNGTTRNHIDADNHDLQDSLLFISDNINTITWGMDSLLNAAPLITSHEPEYSPFYSEIFVIKDGNLVLCYSPEKNHYIGSDCAKFRDNYGKLFYLMLWLAAPTLRPHMPQPCDN